MPPPCYHGSADGDAEPRRKSPGLDAGMHRSVDTGLDRPPTGGPQPKPIRLQDINVDTRMDGKKAADAVAAGSGDPVHDMEIRGGRRDAPRVYW